MAKGTMDRSLAKDIEMDNPDGIDDLDPDNREFVESQKGIDKTVAMQLLGGSEAEDIASALNYGLPRVKRIKSKMELAGLISDGEPVVSGFPNLNTDKAAEITDKMRTEQKRPRPELAAKVVRIEEENQILKQQLAQQSQYGGDGSEYGETSSGDWREMRMMMKEAWKMRRQSNFMNKLMQFDGADSGGGESKVLKTLIDRMEKNEMRDQLKPLNEKLDKIEQKYSSEMSPGLKAEIDALKKTVEDKKLYDILTKVNTSKETPASFMLQMEKMKTESENKFQTKLAELEGKREEERSKRMETEMTHLKDLYEMRDRAGKGKAIDIEEMKKVIEGAKEIAAYSKGEVDSTAKILEAVGPQLPGILEALKKTPQLSPEEAQLVNMYRMEKSPQHAGAPPHQQTPPPASRGQSPSVEVDAGIDLDNASVAESQESNPLAGYGVPSGSASVDAAPLPDAPPDKTSKHGQEKTVGH